MTSSLPPDVQAALNQGEKINAIRLLRQHTGLDLKSAKEAVEAGEWPVPSPPPPARHSHLLAKEVSQALDAGHLFKAVKLVWQRKGSNQKSSTSKFGFTNSDTQRGVYRPGGLGPGEVPHRSLAPGLITFSIALAAVVAWLLLSSE